MLKISRLADYSALIMNFLARKPYTRFSAVQVAEHTAIALPTVSKILKLLLEAGLLESSRGVNGGYRLAKTPDEISMAEIITAIDGRPAMTECAKEVSRCVHNNCSLSHNWRLINEAVVDMLEQLTLSQMGQPMCASQIQPLHFYREKRNVSR